MPTTDVVLDLLPGRYDRDPADLVDQAEASLEDNPEAILAFTEVDRPARGRALEDLARRERGTLVRGRDGWRGESALLFPRAWAVDHTRSWALHPDLPGTRQGCIAVAAGATHKRTGNPLVASVTHLPSGIEDDYKAPGVTPAEQAHARAAARWARRLARAVVPTVALADWNLDLHNPRAEAVVERLLAGSGLELPPARLRPSRGDHGPRLISYPVTRGVRVDGMRVLPEHPASDHDGVRTRLTLATPWRKP